MLVSGDAERLKLHELNAEMQRQLATLQAQFARSRQDLLTQLEARLNTIEQVRPPSAPAFSLPPLFITQACFRALVLFSPCAWIFGVGFGPNERWA